MFYLDKTSRQSVSNGLRVWDKSIYLDGSFRISLVEWKCADKKYFVVDSSIYDSTRSFVEKDKGTAWINIIPDSISEAVYKVICKNITENLSESLLSGKMMVEVTVERVNIRAEPKIDSRVIKRAINGTQFVLLEVKPTGGWYQIILPELNETAWIHGNTIKLIKASSKPNPDKAKTQRHNKRRKSN